MVELMAVVAVIGILVSLALPRFRTFIARSRQAEAAHNLGHIRTLQKSYNLRWQGFGADDVWYYGDLGGNGTSQDTCSTDRYKKNELGFRLEDCEKARYTYDVALGETWSFGRAWNNGTSHHIYPNCSGAGKEDTMYICKEAASLCNSAGAGGLKVVSDIVKECE